MAVVLPARVEHPAGGFPFEGTCALGPGTHKQTRLEIETVGTNGWNLRVVAI